ncbi:MAG: hypothetical protein ABI824_09485 [Acidobacteriota bacterium]
MAAELESVMARYLTAVSRQQDAMLGAEMEVDIDGRLVDLKEEGRMRVKRIISKAGAITFDFLGFNGDERVKKELIQRYLEQDQKARNYGAMSVTPVDYDFKIRAIVTKNVGTPEARTVYVFGVEPRKKEMGLFRGEVWVDGPTGMPLKEAGQIVKSPSHFLTDILFVRDYDLLDGISIVKHFESSAKVRLLGVGRALLDINFSNFRYADLAEAPSVAGF